jgi:hypothetical protein
MNTAYQQYLSRIAERGVFCILDISFNDGEASVPDFIVEMQRQSGRVFTHYEEVTDERVREMLYKAIWRKCGHDAEPHDLNLYGWHDLDGSGHKYWYDGGKSDTFYVFHVEDGAPFYLHFVHGDYDPRFFDMGM